MFPDVYAGMASSAILIHFAILVICGNGKFDCNHVIAISGQNIFFIVASVSKQLCHCNSLTCTFIK